MLSDEIYDAVKKIPKGYVTTYKQIAIMCGNEHYARIVGNTLHKNPDPENIPCHRVVNSQGKLACHFAFGGIECQSKRLIQEGVEVNNGIVDLKKYLWK